ncbi:hypothetical protein CFBP5473_16965 [Agrobacterium larrymoorei]|uniref:Uncharacterized protein n=1 Tax=Agrobacterium larrymoorei TaxID=160699 RepID=A0A4D7DVW8_9HYPH|nr:hypothetical protein CFBP5473_16965 [Agrobacterium larrymoorei]
MHLLPQSFEFQMSLSSSQRAFGGTAALLLPAAVRFFSKSLPHLLPRQAFSFLGLLFFPAQRDEGHDTGNQPIHRPFER